MLALDQTRGSWMPIASGAFGARLRHATDTILERLGVADPWSAFALAQRGRSTVATADAIVARARTTCLHTRWLAAHVAATLPAAVIAELDRELAEAPSDSPGIVGIGLYFLERLPHAGRVATPILRRIVAQLDADAIYTRAGTMWQRDLGVARGAASRIVLLARICAAGLGNGIAWDLLQGAVTWLLSELREKRFIAPSISWCQGELGIACALLCAARTVNEARWAREAIALAHGCRDRDASVGELALCHGSAGVAHMYNRLFQATHAGEFADAAHAWLGRTIAAVRDPRMHGAPGLVQGDAGIALALLAATSDVEPAWDRALTIAVPPHGA